MLLQHLRRSSIEWLAISVISLFAFGQLGCARNSTNDIPDSNLIKPAALARILQDPASVKPQVIHVGFAALYNTNHIPGSTYAGPGARDVGIEKLRSTVAPLAKDADIVLYCGCCPWVNCPNVRPAYAALAKDGYSNVKVLSIDENMENDWIAKGYPTEQPRQ